MANPRPVPLPYLPKGFQRQRTRRCDDCEYRGALDNLGRPIFRSGVRLTAGCETCKGNGRVPVPRRAMTDSYFTGRF